MSKIAIFSDIHGNMPALEAVFEDIRKNNVDKIICLGDLIGKGPSCKRVIDFCRYKCDIVVAGNWDKFLANTREERNKWYSDRIGEERLAYLKQLPESVGFYLSGKFVRLFHAHSEDVHLRMYPNLEVKEKEKMFEIPRITRLEEENVKSDIVGYGDIHGAFIDYLDGERILFNVGSVGCPYDNIPMASYVIIEGDYGSKEKGSFGINFRRVSYDKERVIAEAVEKQLPDLDIFIKEIRSGKFLR